jgi:hypothetical protein
MRALVLLLLSALAGSGAAVAVHGGEQEGPASCPGWADPRSAEEPSETPPNSLSGVGYMAIVGVGLANMALTTTC